MDLDEDGWAIRHRDDAGREDIEPIPADAADVHSRARQMAAQCGGTTEVLRSSDSGWQVVATYTDSVLAGGAGRRG